MNTITLEKAIELAPAIGSNKPSSKVSDKYQFVSSRQILESVQAHKWHIVGVKSMSQSPFAQHRVTLIHENDLHTDTNSEGIMRIEMFNSHNLTKRLMFAVGFFRFVCSNGLVVASGPAETLKLKHRFNQDKLNEIMEHVGNMSQRFPNVLEKIQGFKSRELKDQEQLAYAKFALMGKFRYRPSIPHKFANLEKSAEMLLQPRREEDKGNSTWQVYNRIQENIIKGLEGAFRPVRGYTDEVRINQLLWKGAEITIEKKESSLDSEFKSLLLKDGKKGKISS